MNAISIILVLMVIFIIVFATIKKIEVYSIFTQGVKDALKLIYSIFPAILSVFLMTELFEVSGLSKIITDLLSPVLSFFGVPKELTKLILLKPFSGSGSLALLDEIYKLYGTNSYVSLCASAIFGSSETIFYISAIYFCNCKNKKATKGIIISLIATILSIIFACFICRFFV